MRTVYQLKPKELLEKRISLCHLDFRSLADAPGEENRHFAECRSVSSIIEKERLSLPSSKTRLKPSTRCEGQEKGRKAAGGCEKKSLRDDFQLLFVDEVSLDLEPPLPACWIKQGQQNIIPALQPGAKQHRHILGGYSWNTDAISWKVTTWKNSQSFLEFIDYLLVEFYPTGRIVLVMDNVSYHRSSRRCRFVVVKIVSRTGDSH
jgi:hypothetical protein